MMERFLTLFRRSRDRNDLMAMSDRELADLGVSRAQALELVNLPDDVPGRVAAMGRIFGLSEAELTANRDLWHGLLETCHHCAALPTCARFMASAEAEPAKAGFCPNRAEFTELMGV